MPAGEQTALAGFFFLGHLALLLSCGPMTNSEKKLTTRAVTMARPLCDAKPGRGCKTGFGAPTPLHLARIRAAATMDSDRNSSRATTA
jgi:hypothetical protein